MKRYLGQPRWDTGISPPELMTYIQAHSPGRALDLGCGSGTNLVTLAEHGWQVAGIDYVPKAIRLARRRLVRLKLKQAVRLGDAAKLQAFDRPFDLVLDIGCFHSLSDAEKLAYQKNLDVYLKPGGDYLLYAHLKEAPDAAHGIWEGDLMAFSRFLDEKWRVESSENKPDGNRPAIWVQFNKPN